MPLRVPATWSVHFDVNSTALGEALAAGGLDSVDLGGEDANDAINRIEHPGVCRGSTRPSLMLARTRRLTRVSVAGGGPPVGMLRLDGSAGDSRNA